MTKGAMGNLVNRYRAVLKKCHLMNVFGSLVVAGILIMGAATGEALGYQAGYEVPASPSNVPEIVSGIEKAEEAEANGVSAYYRNGEYNLETIKNITATATGKKEAISIGVLSQTGDNASLTVHLGSPDIVSRATTESGKARSSGINSYYNSTVSTTGGAISSSAESQNGNSTAFGVLSEATSNVTIGGNSITATSESKGADALVNSYGIYAAETGTVTATSENIKIDVSSIAEGKVGDLYAYGIFGGYGSTVTLNNTDIDVQTQADRELEYNTAYGVYLRDDKSTLKIKDGSIRVTATNTAQNTVPGSAIGIQTASGGDEYNITLGNVDITAQGGSATGIELSHAKMTMQSGSIVAESVDGNAQALMAISGTEMNLAETTGEVNLEAKANGVAKDAIALHAEGASTITAGIGSIKATSTGESGTSSDGSVDTANATGMEVYGGSEVTKQGGAIEVLSEHGQAVAIDSWGTGSEIVYGNSSPTSIGVEGATKAYGVRVWDSGKVTLTNGKITTASSGGANYGVYADRSGAVTLAGTTSITASVGEIGKPVYSLYAPSSGNIDVKNASSIEGDIHAGALSAVTATFGDGNLKGWASTNGNGALNLTFGKDAVWEMVSSNKLTKDDGKYTSNLTKLALDDSHVYVGSTQEQWNAGIGFASSQATMSQTDAPAELKIGDLSGSGNFYLRTDMEKDISDSVLVTDTLSGSHNLYTKASGAEPVKTQTASYLARAEQKVGADVGAFALKGGRNVNGQEMIDIGLYNYKLETSERNNGREWYLARVDTPTPDPDPDPTPTPDPDPMPTPDPDPMPTPDPDPMPTPDPDPVPTPDPEIPPNSDAFSPTGEAEAALSGLAGHYAMWYGQLTDLRKRLGEVRYGTQTGLWVRGFADKSRLDGLAGSSFTQNLYGSSIGYDTLLAKGEQYNWIVGMQLRGARADQHVNSRWGGHGNLSSIGGGLYSTWVHDQGWYVDAAATIDWYDHEIRATMLDGTKVHDDRSSYGLGTSLEAGRKIDFAFSNEGRDYWFLEPQLQLSYFWAKGGDFHASNGMKIEQKDMDSLTGRAGLVLGKKFALEGGNGSHYIQPYVKAGLNHEFLGEQEARLNGVRMTSELEGSRGYYGVGVDWQATDNLRLYMQAEREHGEHLTREYNVSAGLKWSF